MLHKTVNYEKIPLRVHVIPKWLKERLEENNLPLSTIAKRESMSNILSGDDFIFYVGGYNVLKFSPVMDSFLNTFPAQFPFIFDKAGLSPHQEFAPFSIFWNRFERLSNELQSEHRAKWILTCGPDVDPNTVDSIKVELVEDSTNLYVVFEPCKKDAVCIKSDCWDLITVLGKHLTRAELLSTDIMKLYTKL